ncbi:MAG TPA: acyl-CoA dehydratase activase-related protein, partial [Bacillota bacterium]|nr:acyl-CoA dehydratase activase-related protein [Bacillota bacterium]
MKIGVPNTLFSAYHLPYWQRLLSLLGVEAVISEPSRLATAQSGSKLLPHEFCLPVKVFLGQIVHLLEQDVDLVLLPTLSSRNRRNFFCPKLIGLPEIVRYTLGLDERFWFAPELNCNGLELEMVHLPQQRLIVPFQFRKIERQANDYWRTVLSRCQREKL